MDHDEAVQYVRWLASGLSCPEELKYVADMADAAQLLEKALRSIKQSEDDAKYEGAACSLTNGQHDMIDAAIAAIERARGRVTHD